MPPDEQTLAAMSSFARLFRPYVEERATWQEVEAMIRDESTWQGAHALFDRIRIKTLSVQEGDDKLNCQYSFEEICAKTLYNFSDPVDPFDVDSPFWVIPLALRFSRFLKLPDSAVLDAIAA
jgi:hypothetical protein